MIKEKEKLKFFSLNRDTVFKALIKDEETREFFRGIIKDYTGIDINDYHLTNNELNTGNYIGDRRLDIVMQSNDGRHLLNIEMNNSNTLKRNENYLEYISINAYLTDIKRNKESDDKYYTVCRQINFNNFLCPNDRKSKYNHIAQRIENGKVVNENFQIFNIALPLFKDKCYTTDKRLTLFTCNSYEEMEEVAEGREDLKKVIEKIKKLNDVKYFIDLYDEEESRRDELSDAEVSGYNSGKSDGISEGKALGITEGRALGIDEGRALGIDEGRTLGISEGKALGISESKKQTARAMLKKGYMLNDISDITGLPKKLIKKLT